MSNYHIVETTNNGDAVHVVFHVPVPDELNEVGHSIRDAIAEDPRFNDNEGMRKSSRVPWIDPAEQIQLNQGNLFEHHVLFITNASIPFSTKQDQMDIMYTNLAISLIDEIRLYYAYWRFARDVP